VTDGLSVGLAISPRFTTFAPLLFGGRLEEGLNVVAELGFDVVELSLRGPDDVDAEWLRKALSQRGLRLAAIATGQACLFDSLCLATSDPAARVAAIDRLKQQIDLAARLGSDVIVGGIRGRLTGDHSEQVRQRDGASAALQECAGHARARGVRLHIEAINRYETNFANTAAEVLELIDEVGSDGLTVLLDTFHMNIEEASIESALRLAGARLGYVHFADSNRRAPGQGHIDFTSILATLAEVGYQGVIAAEIVPLPDDSVAACQTAEFWAAARSRTSLTT
jgi:sugar phosphate isomerase/epimerase